MVYQPTIAQQKQDQALRDALDKFGAAYCAAETETNICPQISSGGTKTRTTRRAEMPDSPRERTRMPQQTIKQQAHSFCDNKENYQEYETIAKLILIGGTVGIAATGLGGVFAAYSNVLVGALGLPSIENACGSRSYFINEALSTFVPGVQSCAKVTQQHEQLAAAGWGSLVAIGALFKISLPGDIREVPGKSIEAIARALCRYYKERELDRDMRQRFNQLAEQLGPDTMGRVEQAARMASEVQSQRLVEEQRNSPRNSPRRSPSPLIEMANSMRRSSTLQSESSFTSSSSSDSNNSNGGGRRRRTNYRRIKKSNTRKGKKSMRRYKKTSRRTRRR